jgi:hypothetical protein
MVASMCPKTEATNERTKEDTDETVLMRYCES